MLHAGLEQEGMAQAVRHLASLTAPPVSNIGARGQYALSPNWKVHSHGVGDPEDDAVTCAPIITGWPAGCFSWGVLLAEGTSGRLEEGVGNWLAGGVVSWTTALPLPFCHFFFFFFFCLGVGGVVCWGVAWEEA